MVLSFDRWVGKVAIVTGASAGIGAEVCKHLVKNGVKVAGLARRQESVEALAKQLSGEKGKLIAIRCDMTKEQDIKAAFKTVKDKLGPVSILINNAGLMKPTNLIDGDTESWKTTLETNVLGLCISTREGIQQMKENKIDGHIIHVNSVLGHTIYPVPGLNIYPASKFAVTALAETLRNEITEQKLKVKITSVSPGLVHTEFVEKAFGADAAAAVVSRPGLVGEDVAEAIIYALSTAPHVNVSEITVQAVGS